MCDCTRSRWELLFGVCREGGARMQGIDTGSTVMAAVFKQEAHKLIDQLPETAGWENLAEQIEVMLDIEAGLTDSAAGRVTDNAEARHRQRRGASGLRSCMKVVWADRAKVRLQQIHAYIAQDQPLNAARVVDRLTHRVAQLAEHPHSGRVVAVY